MSPPDGGRPVRALTRLTLHLGVIVQPYRSWNKKKMAVTTGDVATWLEKRYAIMEVFSRVHQKDIAQAVENSLGGAIDSLVMGRAIDPWGAATQKIQSEFKDFIASQEAERVGIPGTPTLAALMGINHRKKHPHTGIRRPSFLDTGMYMNSFRAWMS